MIYRRLYTVYPNALLHNIHLRALWNSILCTQQYLLYNTEMYRAVYSDTTVQYNTTYTTGMSRTVYTVHHRMVGYNIHLRGVEQYTLYATVLCNATYCTTRVYRAANTVEYNIDPGLLKTVRGVVCLCGRKKASMAAQSTESYK